MEPSDRGSSSALVAANPSGTASAGGGGDAYALIVEKEKLSPPADRFGVPLPMPLVLDRQIFASTWIIAMVLLYLTIHHFTVGMMNTLVVPLDGVKGLAVNATNCDVCLIDQGYMTPGALGVKKGMKAPFAVARFNSYFTSHPTVSETEDDEHFLHVQYKHRINFRSFSCRVYIVQDVEKDLPATSVAVDGTDIGHFYASHTIRAEKFVFEGRRVHARLDGGVKAPDALLHAEEGVIDVQIIEGAGDVKITTTMAPIIIRAATGTTVEAGHMAQIAAEAPKGKLEHAPKGAEGVTLKLMGGGPTVTTDAGGSPVYVKDVPPPEDGEAEEKYALPASLRFDGVPEPVARGSSLRKLEGTAAIDGLVVAEENVSVLEKQASMPRALQAAPAPPPAAAPAPAPAPAGTGGSKKKKKKKKEVDSFVGESGKDIAVHNKTIDGLKKLPEILRSHSHDSWIIKLQFYGSIFPEGSWWFTNSAPYVVTAPGRLSFLSCRFLDPAMIRVPLILTGYLGHANMEEEDFRKAEFHSIRDLLIEKLDGVVDHVDEMPLYFVPTEPSPDNPPMKYMAQKKFVKTEPMDSIAKVPTFIGAAGIATFLSFCTGLGLLFFLVGIMFPFMLEQQEATDTTTVFSHRTVSYLKNQKVSWRLLVISMFRPNYGIVVTWAKRPRSKFFKRMVIDVAATRPAVHSVRLNLAIKDVPTAKMNPDMRRLFVPVDGTETRDPLRMGYMYRIRVQGQDIRRTIIEESMWSNPICIMPRRPIVFVPFVLFKVFLPANTPTLKLFFSKFLVPVNTAYMPIIIKDIVVSDLRVELEESEYFVEIFLGTEPNMREMGFTVSRSESFDIAANEKGQMPLVIKFGDVPEYERPLRSETLKTAREDRIIHMDKWEMKLRRKTHLRIGCRLYDKVLGGHLCENFVGFDSLFNDTYRYKGETEMILRDPDTVPICFVSFRLHFGETLKAKAKNMTPRGGHEQGSHDDDVFIGDYENKRIQEGCETEILWNEDHPLLRHKGKPAPSIGMSLTDGEHVIETVGEGIKNYGSLLWVVSFGGTSPTNAFFTIEVDGRTVATSTSHICQKSLLLAELEFAYASFCRMNQIKMKRVTMDSCAVYGGRVAPVSVQITEGMRKPLPYESPEFEDRRCFNSPMEIMCSPAAVDNPPGSLRSHPVVMNLNLNPNGKLWKRDLLLAWKMDWSFHIADFICDVIYPLCGEALWDLIGDAAMGEEWANVRMAAYKHTIAVIRFFLYIAAFYYQAVFFLLFPMTLFFMIVKKFLIQSEYESEKGPSMDPIKELLSARDLWSQTGPMIHVLLAIGVIHAGLTMCCITYHILIDEALMTILKYAGVKNISDIIPPIQQGVDKLNQCLIVFGLFFLSFAAAFAVIWICLACVINPVLMGYFIMIAGLFIVAYAMIGKLTEVGDVVNEAMESIIPPCLSAVLDRALERCPVETELQKKVRLKERDDLVDAIKGMVKEAGFEVGAYDEIWESMGIEADPPDSDDEEPDAGGLSKENSEKLELLYIAQLKMLPKAAVDPDELLPKNFAESLRRALRGLLDRMLGMQEEFVMTLANESREQVFKVFYETMKALTDPDYIDLEVARTLNDTLNEVIDNKFKQLLNKLMPESTYCELRKTVRESMHKQKSKQRPKDKLTDFDKAVIANDKPRIHKTELPKFLCDCGLFEGVEKSKYQLTDKLEVLDSNNDKKVWKTTKALTVPMMQLLQDILNDWKFQSTARRDNCFIAFPELMKMYDMLTESSLWWDAFQTMITDFEILTDLPKAEFTRRVRQVFDHWSEGNGMMPQNEATNAVLELTSGGVWLQGMQRLLMKLKMCGQYADGDSRDKLLYAGFKRSWMAAAGKNGFVDKTRIKSFIHHLEIDDKTGNARGMWFEAFVIALERLRMTVKLSTQIKLFKEVDRGNDGFLTLEDFSQVIRNICDRGIWRTAYDRFLDVNAVDLPESVQTKFWVYLNEDLENPGLVPMEKMCTEIEKMVMTSGIMQSVLITAASLMEIATPDIELRFLHVGFDDNHNGFMPYEDLYALIDKVGRRGMPYARFKVAVAWMGFKFDEEALYEIFAALDVNQDMTLDWSEFRGGMQYIVSEKLPEAILLKIGMSKIQVVKAVLGVISVMAVLFAFLLLALMSFGGGRAIIASIQSGFASAITYGSKAVSSGDLDTDKYTKMVTNMIANAMGMTPPR